MHACMHACITKTMFFFLSLTITLHSCYYYFLKKDFKSFYILMLGRLLGGVSTSLLFSVFDAWLIHSHTDAKLKSFLGRSFSWAAYGNSLVAILAGLVANKAASLTNMVPIYSNQIYIGGFLTPFDIALGSLIMCAVLAATLWEENYGESEESADTSRLSKHTWYDGLASAYTTTIRSQDILLCGIISSLFEGSMYIFVFMWTPALTQQHDDTLPFGLIFSTFMVCCMAGSSMFSIQMERMKNEELGVMVFAVAAFAMALVALSPSTTLKFLAMNLFEMTVGMYWPIMGTMKGAIVPESKRAGIYNLYRIPLNFIVLFSLLTDLTPTVSFALNALMLSTATVLQTILMKRREMHGKTESEKSGEAEQELLLRSNEKADASV